MSSSKVWLWWMLILCLGVLLAYGWTKYRLILVPAHELAQSKYAPFKFNKASDSEPAVLVRRTGDDVLTDEEILVDEQKVELLAELRSKKILTEEDWILFERLFLQVHPDFLVHLRFRHKQITPSEEKLACLIRLHFSTKEIARLLAVSTHAVNVGRYRLKKRFALDGNLRLEEYLMGF
jgi:DNA-binding CsgD family transcriptional regulator